MKPSATTTLANADWSKWKPGCLLRGWVINEKGEPVVGAMVEPQMYWKGESANSGWPGAERLAVTDSRGEFRLGLPEPGMQVSVSVSAPDFASRQFQKLAAAETNHKLQLSVGVTVSGRVVKNGEPLAGVVVGVVQKDRSFEHYLGHHEIATNEKGEFTIPHLPPKDTLLIYGLMNSLRPHGMLPIREFQTGESDTERSLGLLEVVPGFRVSGRVITADGTPIPKEARVLFGRDEAWDHEILSLDDEGRFTVDHVAKERVRITFQCDGHRLTSATKHRDPQNPNTVVGVIVEDVPELLLVCEPGETERPQFTQVIGTEAIRQYSTPLYETPSTSLSSPPLWNHPRWIGIGLAVFFVALVGVMIWLSRDGKKTRE